MVSTNVPVLPNVGEGRDARIWPPKALQGETGDSGLYILLEARYCTKLMMLLLSIAHGLFHTVRGPRAKVTRGT